MTRDQLNAIRARYADEPLLGEMRTDRFGNLITVTREHPVVTLLAEVERLTAERDSLKSKASTVCTFLMPSGQWSWFVTPGPLAASLVTHSTRREAEEAAEAHAQRAGWPRVDRFNCQAEALDLSAERDAAFKRGVAAMREAAATHVAFGAHPSSLCGPTVTNLANEVRDLPDPEDK